MADNLESGATGVRVLFVEDDEADAALAADELRRVGWRVTWRRVDTLDTMRDALVGGGFDLVVSDSFLERLSAAEALALHARFAPDLPFVIVSGGRRDLFQGVIGQLASLGTRGRPRKRRVEPRC
jgi:DNA-binding NtrC family response regulator